MSDSLVRVFKTGQMGTPLAITHARYAAMSRLDGASIMTSHEDDFSSDNIHLGSVRHDGLRRPLLELQQTFIIHAFASNRGRITAPYPPDNFKHS
ncbi:hypothetical protein HPP92_001967 [Vanilla planifolia]|uniref:Uncharacterized protein n=1 Tax=Vanilla planifolia TaxID=51239 RepID=A0A835VI14_VANPL|nr:hypothetical protein HPP92_001967 [Vanilla planifolia]